MKFNNIYLYQVLSFSEFFPGQTINIDESLKRFKKADLLDAISVLSFNYKNAHLSDSDLPFFSRSNNKYVDEINNLASHYLQDKPKGFVPYFVTYRTTLQLLRHIFDIPYHEYRGDIEKEDIEYILFKIILAVNEELYCDRLDTDNEAEIMFYLQYAMNDMNQNSLYSLFQTQVFYASKLFEFLERDKRNADLYQKFLDYYGINHWSKYISTILSLVICFKSLENFSEKEGTRGNPKIIYSSLSGVLTERISKNVLDKISISIEQSISFDSSENKNRNNNIDYRKIRSCPFIKESPDIYYPVNLQMIGELIYNSNYFVLSSLYGKEFNSFYYKHFVEEFLLHRTLNDICNNNRLVDYYYPTKQMILSDDYINEDENEPDFYVRSQESLCIFECKAFKLNGEFKEKGLVKPLIDEFYSKVVCHTNPKGKEVISAVKQLANQVVRIENNKFIWDDDIPDSVAYYPVLVFEDPKLVNVGTAHLIQDWYNDEIRTKCDIHTNAEEAFYPIVTLSIKTLFLYKADFRKYGFSELFNRYFEDCALFDKKSGWSYKMNMTFDDYMASTFTNKEKNYYKNFTNKVLGLNGINNKSFFRYKN